MYTQKANKPPFSPLNPMLCPHSLLYTTGRMTSCSIWPNFYLVMTVDEHDECESSSLCTIFPPLAFPRDENQQIHSAWGAGSTPLFSCVASSRIPLWTQQTFQARLEMQDREVNRLIEAHIVMQTPLRYTLILCYDPITPDETLFNSSACGVATDAAQLWDLYRDRSSRSGCSEDPQRGRFCV